MIEKKEGNGTYILSYGDHRIPFHVDFEDRMRLAITVHPEMRLQVAAPAGKPIDQVLTRVSQRAGWITKQWRYFEQFQPNLPERRYVSGETHVYLGRQYRLKVSVGSPSSVKLIGRFLHVRHNDRHDILGVKNLVDRWYRDHARGLFEHRLAKCLEDCRALRLKTVPRVRVRKMTRRWGSCTKAGNILLNVELVKVPVHCVDYVIIHELCHLRVHDHSPGFYRLLTRCMPNWQRRKERLDSFRLE